MNKLIRNLLLFLSVALLAGCAALLPAHNSGDPCVAKSFTVLDSFAGARRGRCVIKSPNKVRLYIRAEDERVTNSSPWYAFKLSPSEPTTATVELKYEGSKHRYWPKLSTDGIHWKRADETDVTVSTSGSVGTIRVALTDQTVWVSAQEIILPTFYDAWNNELANNGVVDVSELGRSRRDQPIAVLDTKSDARDVLLIVGRQHPPEVTGALAFFSFAETLFSDTELAIRFRQEFRIIAIPLLNPDGVLGGNWRHNLGKTDLNRDWGPFEQPETRAVDNLLSSLDGAGVKIRMFADFHSTNRNLLYTQSADYPTDPVGFTPTWLDNAEARLSNYNFTNEAAAVSEQANSKNYMFKRYGIPSVTFEVGDETERDAIRNAAVIFAEELMELLLAQNY